MFWRGSRSFSETQTQLFLFISRQTCGVAKPDARTCRGSSSCEESIPKELLALGLALDGPPAAKVLFGCVLFWRVRFGGGKEQKLLKPFSYECGSRINQPDGSKGGVFPSDGFPSKWDTCPLSVSQPGLCDINCLNHRCSSEVSLVWFRWVVFCLPGKPI